MSKLSETASSPIVCGAYLGLDEENADVSLWCEKEPNHEDDYHEVRCVRKKDGRIFTTTVEWREIQSWGVKEDESTS